MIIGIIFMLIMVIVTLEIGKKNNISKANKINNEKQKLLIYKNILRRWVANGQNNRVIADYFRCEEIETIAIYGMGELGELLLRELTNSGIQVSYALDQNLNKNVYGIQIKRMDDELEYVDAIVVTPIVSFLEIEKCLKEKKSFGKIIPLDEVIFGL